MKFIKRFENFTETDADYEMQPDEMDLFSNEDEDITVPPNQEEFDDEWPMYFQEEEEEVEGGMMPGEEEELPMAHEEEEDGDEMMPSGHKMGHIMTFHEAKKSTSKKKKDVMPDFPDVDKDGDKKESIKKANADKKKAEGKKGDDKKETKKGGLSKAQEKLPEGLKKAIKAGVRD